MVAAEGGYEPREVPEYVLCDTSFVGHTARRLANLGLYEAWEGSQLTRVEMAVKAISVVTIAEERKGQIYAGWGQRKIEASEQRLASYVPIPLDSTIVDEWARLAALSKKNGWNVGDNDLWIASTAGVRGFPLVTCDDDQVRIEDDALEVLYFAPPG